MYFSLTHLGCSLRGIDSIPPRGWHGIPRGILPNTPATTQAESFPNNCKEWNWILFTKKKKLGLKYFGKINELEWSLIFLGKKCVSLKFKLIEKEKVWEKFTKISMKKKTHSCSRAFPPPVFWHVTALLCTPSQPPAQPPSQPPSQPPHGPTPQCHTTQGSPRHGRSSVSSCVGGQGRPPVRVLQNINRLLISTHKI